ncbi:MAG: HAAS signaling domain-containing protein [Parvularculaceae bacterium]
MTNDRTGEQEIETYIGALTRALRALPEADRADIAAEIRAHLEHRSREGRLAEAVKALGSPETCARGFLEEIKIQDAFADGGPVKTIGALVALASRRLTATAGLFVSLIFFALAAGFGFTAVAEIVTPEAAGLWVNPDAGIFMMGTLDAPPPATRELLGRWLFPVAIALAVLSFVAGQWLGRFFVRLMAGRKARLAV